MVGLVWIRDLGGGDRAQRLWLVATIAVPIFALGMNLALTEAPLFFGWMLTVWALWRAREGGLAWWLLAGVGAGAALLSKYTGVFLLPGGLLVLMMDRLLRRQLRRPGPWLALLVAAVCFSPVVIWNARHGWASFRFQTMSRYSGHHQATLGVLELIGGQLVVLTPLVAVAMVAAVGWSIRAMKGDPRAAWILAFGVPLPVSLALQSPWDPVKLNWLAPAYLTLVIGTILWLAERRVDRLVPRCAHAARWIAVFFVLALVASPAVRLTPAAWGNTWSGWGEISSAAERWEERLDEDAGGEGHVFFFVNGANEAAALEFALSRTRGEPSPLEPVLAQNAVGEHALAFDYWTAPASLAGNDAVAVVLGDSDDRRDELLTKIRRCFKRVDHVEEVAQRRFGVVTQRASIWVCRGYQPPVMAVSRFVRAENATAPAEVVESAARQLDRHAGIPPRRSSEPTEGRQ